MLPRKPANYDEFERKLANSNAPRTDKFTTSSGDQTEIIGVKRAPSTLVGAPDKKCASSSRAVSPPAAAPRVQGHVNFYCKQPKAHDLIVNRGTSRVGTQEERPSAPAPAHASCMKSCAGPGQTQLQDPANKESPRAGTPENNNEIQNGSAGKHPLLRARGPAPRAEFRLQQQAFDFLDQQSNAWRPHLRVFGSEWSQDGKRRFLVTTPTRLWTDDVEPSDPLSCHLYEIIREGAPCHLYFDLEFLPHLNPGVCGDTLVDLLVELVAEELSAAFDIRMPLGQQQDTTGEEDVVGAQGAAAAASEAAGVATAAAVEPGAVASAAISCTVTSSSAAGASAAAMEATPVVVLPAAAPSAGAVGTRVAAAVEAGAAGAEPGIGPGVGVPEESCQPTRDGSESGSGCGCAASGGGRSHEEGNEVAFGGGLAVDRRGEPGAAGLACGPCSGGDLAEGLEGVGDGGEAGEGEAAGGAVGVCGEGGAAGGLTEQQETAEEAPPPLPPPLPPSIPPLPGGAAPRHGADCSWVWELCSTTPSKFSRHLLVRIPHCAFKDNFHVNAFVRRLFERIAADPVRFRSFFVRRSDDPGELPGLFIDPAVYTRNRAFRLYLSCKAGKTAVLRATGRYAVAALLRQRGLLPAPQPDPPLPLLAPPQLDPTSPPPQQQPHKPLSGAAADIDTCGGGADSPAVGGPIGGGGRDVPVAAAAEIQDKPLAPLPATTQQGGDGACGGGGGGNSTVITNSPCRGILLPADQELLIAREVFLATLVTNVGRVDRTLTLPYGNGNDGRTNGQGATALLPPGQSEAPSSSSLLAAAAAGLCLGIPRIPLPCGSVRQAVQGRGGGDGPAAAVHAAGGAVAGEEFRYGPSPFPRIEEFIESVCCEGGVQGRVRCWQLAPASGTLLLSIRNNRWCANVGRPHRSNGIYYVVDMKDGVWCQRCYDPQCRDFRSALMPLPRHLWEANSHEAGLGNDQDSSTGDFIIRQNAENASGSRTELPSLAHTEASGGNGDSGEAAFDAMCIEVLDRLEEQLGRIS